MKENTFKRVMKDILEWCKRYSAQLIFLIVLFTFLSFASPVFLTKNNLINVLRQISTTLIMGCASTFIMICGGIDLSSGSIMAVAGMVCTYATMAGIPFVPSLLITLIVGAFVGFINGAIISNTTLPAFIVTYSMQSILRGIVYIITQAATIRIANETFLKFGNGFLGFIPLPVVFLFVIVVISNMILTRTKLGRHIYAVGGNEKAARFAGINVKNVRMFIYIANGVLASVAGLILTARNTSMQPTLGTGSEMDAIAAVVLGGTSMAGGKGSVQGTIIGALIIGFINNGLNLMGLDGFYQYIAKGLVILLAVYVDYVKSLAISSGKAIAKEKK